MVRFIDLRVGDRFAGASAAATDPLPEYFRVERVGDYTVLVSSETALHVVARTELERAWRAKRIGRWR